MAGKNLQVTNKRTVNEQKKESTRFILNILKAALSILNSFNSFNTLEYSFLNYLMAFITLLFIIIGNNNKLIAFNL